MISCKRVFVTALSIVLVLGAGCTQSSKKTGDLREDEKSSESHFYSNGNLMRVDYLNHDEELARSQWFSPAGEVFAESVFEAGTGFEIQLHDNGRLKLFAPTKGWLFEGMVVEFDEAGVPASYAVYSLGKPGPKVSLPNSKERSEKSNGSNLNGT